MNDYTINYVHFTPEMVKAVNLIMKELCKYSGNKKQYKAFMNHYNNHGDSSHFYTKRSCPLFDDGV